MAFNVHVQMQGMGNPIGQQQQPQMQMHAPPQRQPSQHYGSYSGQMQENVFSQNAWQAMSFNTEDEFHIIFDGNKSQRFNAIQAHELVQIMNSTPRIRNYYGIEWSLELCKIMIAMLDRSKDGLMQYEEFRELLQCLVYWHQTFSQYDTNRSGFMEAHELARVTKDRFGYQISQKAMEYILKRYSRAMDDGRCLIAFDDFVSCCVRLRAYTEAFRARDRQSHGGYETGKYEFSYDDYLQCTMCL